MRGSSKILAIAAFAEDVWDWNCEQNALWDESDRWEEWQAERLKNLGMSISRLIYARAREGGVTSLKIAAWRAGLAGIL